MVMTAMYGINKVGLRERPSYDQLIGYLQGGQEKIRYPDRFAKRVRESPQLSNLLDGEGFSINDINEQQMNHAKEIAKQLAILQAGGDAHLLRTSSQEPSNVNSEVDNLDNQVQDQAEQISEVISEDNANIYKKKQDMVKKNEDEHLNVVTEEQQRALHGIAPTPKTQYFNIGDEPDPQPSSSASSSYDPISGTPITKDPNKVGKPGKEPEPPDPTDKTASKGKGRPKKPTGAPPIVPVPPKPPPSKKSSSTDQPKSLNLLHKAKAEEIPVPRGAMSTTSTSSGSNGNGSTSESSSRERAKSQPPASSSSSSIPNKEKLIVDDIVE